MVRCCGDWRCASPPSTATLSQLTVSTWPGPARPGSLQTAQSQPGHAVTASPVQSSQLQSHQIKSNCLGLCWLAWPGHQHKLNNIGTYWLTQRLPTSLPTYHLSPHTSHLTLGSLVSRHVNCSPKHPLESVQARHYTATHDLQGSVKRQMERERGDFIAQKLQRVWGGHLGGYWLLGARTQLEILSATELYLKPDKVGWSSCRLFCFVLATQPSPPSTLHHRSSKYWLHFNFAGKLRWKYFVLQN